MFKQSDKLTGNHPTFGEQCAALFECVAKIVVQSRVWKDNRFAEQGTVFRAANIEHIRHACDVLPITVCIHTAQRTAQTRTVNVEPQTMRITHRTQGKQFGAVVHRAQFSRLRNECHARFDRVLVRMSAHHLLNRSRREFAVDLRYVNHLVPCRFNCTCFVRGNMS